jgi:imidazolonepropionase-like amidohydrolase
MHRREFVKAAGTAGLAIASLKPVSEALASASARNTQPSSRNVVLTNASLIDCVQPEPQLKATVVVKDGRIVRAGTAPATQTERQDTTVIDLAGAWLLPGLWDVHVHLQFPEITLPKDLSVRTIRYGLNAIDGLREAGITGIRTAGVDNWIDVAWKAAFSSGEFVGPRIFAGGHFLTTTAGHGHGQEFAVESDGPETFLRAVREEIQKGVDHIKLNLSGGIMGPPWDRHWHNFFLPEELDAVFRLCRLRGYRVMAHATNPVAVKEAIRLGAWSIEHGYMMDDECIRMMLEKKTFYVPTLGVSHLTPKQITNKWERQFMEMWATKIPPEFFARADQAMEEHKRVFQAALKAGVKMALGSDLGPLKDGALLEMGLWIRNGATSMQVIKAATKSSAEICGVGDDLGTIERRKIADLIVVKDSPLADVNNLRTLQLVFKDGQLVVDKRAGNS